MARPDPQWQRMWDLFHEAVGRSAAERAAFVERESRDEPELCDEVLRLLASHDRSAGLLDSVPPWRETVERAELDEPAPGEWIGPHRLLRIVGEGGMGIIYEAEQREPVRRRVALKLIRLGMDTREVVSRFEAERQALALMDHPGIARVFDAGATERGRPYFVMEYVDGVRITRFCDERRLDTRGRLDLFLGVCDAVHHAHQKGIIHRDLKPSNVLVTEVDGRPAPKIIDFGVAKATEQRLTERTLFTRLGAMIGTPEYMSPEQAEASPLDVDTRTDVYSLGVLLYELLVGTHPLETASLRDASYDEIRRRIREEEPPRPSTRLSTLAGDSSAEVASRRRTDPATLRRRVHGDLDWITMRALDKDRNRRYGSAAELAGDIRRHLRHEPVLAGPPGVGYRVGKFVRRHRFGVLVAGSIALLVLGFGVMMTVQSLKLARALTATDHQRVRAEQVSSFLVDLLKQTDPDVAGAEPPSLRDVLDRGAQRISTDLVEQPAVRATLMDTMGQAYLNLGFYDQAAPLFEEALTLRRQSFGQSHPAVADSINQLAILRYYQSDFDSAESLFRQALEMRRQVLDAPNPDLAESMNNLAEILRDRGDLEAAEPLHREALAMRREALGERHADVGESLNNLGILLRNRGDYEGSESCYRQALDIWRGALGDRHPRVAMALNNLAVLLHFTGDLEESARLYEESLAIRLEVLGERHPLVALTTNNLANLLFEKGDYEVAESRYRQALALRRQQLGDEHHYVAWNMNTLANLLLARGVVDEAERLHREALAMQRRLLGDEHVAVAGSLGGLGNCAKTRGGFDEAERLHREAVAMFRRLRGGEGQQLAEALYNLGRTLRDRGNAPAAEGPLREAVEMQRKLLGDGHLDLANSTGALARVSLDLGDAAEAERLHRRAREILRGKLPPSHPRVAFATVGLGEALMARGGAAAGAPLLREGLSALREALPAGHWQISVAESALGECLAAQGRFDDAERLLTRAHTDLRGTRGEGYRGTVRARELLARLRDGR